MLLGLHRTEAILVKRTVHRLQVCLLAELRVAIIIRAHLHVAEIQGLLVGLVRRVRFQVLGTRRRVTRVLMRLYLLLELVLTDQVLVPGRVVVVGEELGEEQVHVGALLAAPAVPSLVLPILIRLLLAASIIVVIAAQVETVQILCMTRAQLNRAALLSNHVIASGCVLVGFQALVSHGEHLTSEGLSHDGLTTLASRLRQDTRRGNSRVHRLAHSVRSVRLLH